MTPAVRWLAGRRALIAGGSAAIDIVVAALQRAGAQVTRSSIAAGDEDGIADEMALLFDAGGVDILVHGGAPDTERSALETGLDDWRTDVSADLDLRFLQSAEYVRRCVAAGQAGAILFLAPSTQPRAGHAAAATLTGAIDNLVKTLAVEWARDGIRINVIASRLHESQEGGDDVARESLGNLAAYLLSDYAAYVSGMVMGIDEI
jgi:NAD(P)-dependent dehydrogenase (short-subunit alcohol dehydrogenase family)